MTTKVAVITGGAGGMGFATAKLLADDYRLVLCDVVEQRLEQAAGELRALGADCETMACDVTEREAVERVAERASSIGTVASVVHTAGVSPKMGSADKIVKINALGTIHIAESFIRVAGSGFSLVNVASSAGHLPQLLPTPKRIYGLASTDTDRFVERMAARCNLLPERMRSGFAYALSKNFVIWYTQHLAKAFGRKGASIMSVSPGSIDTGMGRLEESSGAGELASRSALGRYGRVEEIAEVLAFLARGRAGYVTGTDILVDGGASATITLKDTIAMARSL
jgi:NAD(P)-dependent dehydrogenase (short-subunit alcohol dehydrogenase family)